MKFEQMAQKVVNTVTALLDGIDDRSELKRFIACAFKSHSHFEHANFALTSRLFERTHSARHEQDYTIHRLSMAATAIISPPLDAAHYAVGSPVRPIPSKLRPLTTLVTSVDARPQRSPHSRQSSYDAALIATIRPTPLLQDHKDMTIQATLIRMGFSAAVASRATTEASLNEQSLERIIDTAIRISEVDEAERVIATAEVTVVSRNVDSGNVDISVARHENEQMVASPSLPQTLSAVIAEQPPTEWECVRCTFLNTINITRCTMCAFTRVHNKTTAQTITAPQSMPYPASLPVSLSVSSPPSSSRSVAVPTTDEQKSPSLDDLSSFCLSDCLICFDIVPQSNLIQSECGHAYCQSCWRGYLTCKIIDGQVLHIKCPNTTCTRELTADEIRTRITTTSTASIQLRQKFDRFYQNAMDSLDANVRFCSQPDCDGVMRGSKQNSHLVCPKCENELCFLCNSSWHYGRSCASVVNAELKQYMSAHDTKPCPRCHCPIERAEGCHHMVCSRCRYEFCWLCSRQYTKDHYALYNVWSGCSGLQMEETNYLGNDQVCGYNASFGCGFAGVIKRTIFRIWVILAFMIVLLGIIIFGIPLFLLGGGCIYYYLYHYKRNQGVVNGGNIQETAEERRSRRRERALLRRMREESRQMEMYRKRMEQERNNNNKNKPTNDVAINIDTTSPQPPQNDNAVIYI